MTKAEKLALKRMDALNAYLSATTGQLEASSIARSYGVDESHVTKILQSMGRLKDDGPNGRQRNEGSIPSGRTQDEGGRGRGVSEGGGSGSNHLAMSSQSCTQSQEAPHFGRSARSSLNGWACLCGAQEEAAEQPAKCWSCGGDMHMWRASAEAQTT